MPTEKQAETSQEGESIAAQFIEPSILARGCRVLRRAVFYWIVGLGIVVTAMGLGEMTARAVLNHLSDRWFKAFASMSQYAKRPGLKFAFSYQPGFGIYPNPDFHENSDMHNSRGFRGDEIPMPKPPGTFRIACLGGSTTYDVKIDNNADTYPSQLQEGLRNRGIKADVVNAGCPAWTSREQILNLVMRVSYLEPDLIVYFEPFNDLVYRATWPPEKCRADYTNPSVRLPELFNSPWYMSLALVRIPLILTRLELPNHVDTSRWCDSYNHQGMRNILGMSKTAEDDCRGLMPSSIPAGMTLRDVFAATPTEFYANNVSSLVFFAKQRQAKVLLVSGVLDWKRIENSWVDQGEGLHYGVAQMNETLATVAREQKVFYYDLAGEWPDDSSYWAEEVHNNKAGAHLKAELIASFIAKMNLKSAVD